MALAERWEKRVARGDGCWEWRGARRSTRGGYGTINASAPPYPPRVLLAHRVAYELHVGPIPEGMLVCHRCDNPPCVRPDHLFLGSAADNSADMMAKGRHRPGVGNTKTPSPGAANGKAVLTGASVREIRRLYGTAQWTKADLARRFGIAHTTVRKALARQTWDSVPE